MEYYLLRENVEEGEVRQVIEDKIMKEISGHFKHLFRATQEADCSILAE